MFSLGGTAVTIRHFVTPLGHAGWVSTTGEGPKAPSLATNGELRHFVETEIGSRCPRKLGFVMLSLSTGVVMPARCDANFCPYCAPIKASQIARAMALAEPERMIRLSLIPDRFPDSQRAVKSLVKWLRRNFGRVELCYSIEPNPKGTGNHAHAWQHGPRKIPQAALQEACHRVGLGFPDIRRWRNRGGATGYGLKGIGYGMKSDDLETFLDLNGGRLVHATRDFFRDGRQGERLTMGEAKRLAAPESEDPGPWVLRAE